MVDKVILQIHHSDDYTDYLLMMAGLTNKRIVPVMWGSGDIREIKNDKNTLVLRCYASEKELSTWDRPVEFDPNYGSVRILSRFYLADDGSIHAPDAEMVRQAVQEVAMNALLSPANLIEVYRQ